MKVTAKQRINILIMVPKPANGTPLFKVRKTKKTKKPIPKKPNKTPNKEIIFRGTLENAYMYSRA